MTRGGGVTLNVEVIGMLVGNFLESPKIYPDFDFKTPKYPNCNFEGSFGKMAFHFSKHFPETPKNYQNQNCIPQEYDEHTNHFGMEVPPGGSK